MGLPLPLSRHHPAAGAVGAAATRRVMETKRRPRHHHLRYYSQSERTPWQRDSPPAQRWVAAHSVAAAAAVEAVAPGTHAGVVRKEGPHHFAPLNRLLSFRLLRTPLKVEAPKRKKSTKADQRRQELRVRQVH